MSYSVGVKMMNCAEIINTEKIVNILLLQEHPSNPSIQAAEFYLAPLCS